MHPHSSQHLPCVGSAQLCLVPEVLAWQGPIFVFTDAYCHMVMVSTTIWLFAQLRGSIVEVESIYHQ